MSRSGYALRWSCWVVAVVVVVTMTVFAITSIKSGTPKSMEWGNIGLFVGAVAAGLGGPYVANRATFKHNTNK